MSASDVNCSELNNPPERYLTSTFNSNHDWKLSPNVQVKIVLKKLEIQSDMDIHDKKDDGQEYSKCSPAPRCVKRIRTSGARSLVQSRTGTINTHSNSRQQLQRIILEIKDECNICCNFVYQLSQHIRTIHSTSPLPSTGIRRSKCQDSGHSVVIETEPNISSLPQEIIPLLSTEDIKCEPGEIDIVDRDFLLHNVDPGSHQANNTGSDLCSFEDGDDIRDNVSHSTVESQFQGESTLGETIASPRTKQQSGRKKLKISAVADKPYKCDKCGIYFTRQDAKKRHFLKKHPHELPYKCNVCPARFKEFIRLTRHKKIHTRVQSEKSIRSTSSSAPPHKIHKSSINNTEREDCSILNVEKLFTSTENHQTKTNLVAQSHSPPTQLELSDDPLLDNSCEAESEVTTATGHRRSFRRRKSINYAELNEGPSPTTTTFIDRPFTSIITQRQRQRHHSLPSLENIKCETDLLPSDVGDNADPFFIPESSHEIEIDSHISSDISVHEEGDEDSDSDAESLGERRTSATAVSKSVTNKICSEGNGRKCNICTLEFPTVKHLNDHFKSIHKENLTKPYKCNICETRFSNTVEIRKHIDEIHPNTVPYACKTCKKIFFNESDLNTHTVLHCPVNSYKCDNCNCAFGQVNYLENHMGIHTKEKPHKCETCEKSFYTKDALIIHRETHVFGKTYDCNQCDKVYSSKYLLRRHTKIHNGSKNSVVGDDGVEGQRSNYDYGCGFCSIKYPTTRDLSKHLQRRHTEILHKEYVCKFCKEEFFSTLKLNTHVDQAHPGEKPFECTICHKEFSKQYLLTKHLTTHAEEATVPCTHKGCTKMFNTKKAMRRHLITHTGEKFYKCEQCEKTFTTSSSLSRHREAHTGDKPFMCEICSKCFGTNGTLGMHMLIHKEEGGVKFKPHVCKDCGKGFTRKDQLTTHSLIHTGVKRHMCEECGLCFRLPHQLRAHLKKSSHAN